MGSRSSWAVKLENINVKDSLVRWLALANKKKHIFKFFFGIFDK